MLNYITDLAVNSLVCWWPPFLPFSRKEKKKNSHLLSSEASCQVGWCHGTLRLRQHNDPAEVPSALWDLESWSGLHAGAKVRDSTLSHLEWHFFYPQVRTQCLTGTAYLGDNNETGYLNQDCPRKTEISLSLKLSASNLLDAIGIVKEKEKGKDKWVIKIMLSYIRYFNFDPFYDIIM